MPQPGNPQDYNRYTYVRNSPLSFTDPTGHVTAAQCGAISDAAKSQFCWDQRYYEARGLFWDNHDWKRDSSRDPVIEDAGIADEVLAEAGIGLQSHDGLLWTDDYKMAAGSGVAKFGQKLSGGLGRLKVLLDGGATLHLVLRSPLVCGVGALACAPKPGSDVWLPKQYFANLTTLPMDIVHELGHVIDWHSSIWVNGHKDIFSGAWKSYPAITQYAATSAMGEWDIFAEAVTVAVYGQAYEKRAGTFRSASKWQSQATRMLELLNGWR